MRRMLLLACLGVGLSGCQDSGNARNPAPSDSSPDIAEAPLPDIGFETYVAAGDLAASRGQNQRAAEQYEKALKQRSDAPVLKKLAIAHAKSGQTTASIETWKRFLVASSYSADGYGSLGYAYELAGNAPEAEKTYLEGISKHPKGSLVRINYGLMLVRRNKVEQAIEQLSAVLQPHEVNYNIASVYEQVGRRDLAQFYYRKSLEANPQYAPAKQRLAALG